MPPPSSDPAANGNGFRIAGAASSSSIRIAGSASRATASNSNSVAPSPSRAGQGSRSPIKVDRDAAIRHGLPVKPALDGSSRRRSGPIKPPTQDEEEEEEGAIEEKPKHREAPAPPKTPPHPARRSSGAAEDRGARRGGDRGYQAYQPRSPSPPRSRPSEPSSSAAYVPRSPSPPRSRGEYADPDPRQYRPPERSTYDSWRPGGGASGAPGRYDDHRSSSRGESGWDAPVRGTRGWEDDRRDYHGGERRWGEREVDRRAERPVRGPEGWEREPERRLNRPVRGEEGWERDRYPNHHHHHNRGGERSDRGYDREPPRSADRAGRDRESSPPSTNPAPAREGGFAKWSPTPPTQTPSLAPSSSTNGNGSAFAQRPPSRMGRVEPPPPLSAPPRDSGESSTSLKRPRSPSSSAAGTPRSPPAGLLKRKANFNAVVVPPPVVSPKAEVKESSTNVAPGAPLPPKINTLESPPPPSSASVAPIPSAPHPAKAAADEANFNQTVQVLDDTSTPSVRLSSLPRRPASSSPALSGPERRRARPPSVPLNQRKFLGCSSLDDYEISIKLGQGTFGEVLKGRHILSGTAVALKKVTIHDAKDGLPITALREIKLLKKLRHPSIVPVIDMAYRPSGERGKLGDVYMVEPYMDHDLNGMLENPSIRLEMSQIKLYMKQLLEGTLYLHKNRILHRDMKAANLLINNAGQLQIADFGLARPYRDPGQSWRGGWMGGVQRYTNMVVTRWYRPPELLAGEKKYGPPIDMWGIGCILAEMITGRPLFKGTSELNQLELISQLCGSPNESSFPGWSSLPGVKDADPTGRPDPHPEVPGKHDFGSYERRVKEQFTTVIDAGPGCADLIDKLLVLDPRKRLTAQGALEHEWFWQRPFPADPASLPKYEHSKEIDRVRREWKPAPAPVQAVAAPVANVVPRGPGGQGQMGQGGYQQFPRPPAPARGFSGPNGAPVDAPLGPAGYAAPPQVVQQAAQRPPMGPRFTNQSQQQGGGRHPFPTGPAAMAGGGGRFPHPNNQRGPPQQGGYPNNPQQQGGGRPQQYGFPPRPPTGPGGSGGGGGGAVNPYSM